MREFDLNWDELLAVETASLEDERNMSVSMSDYRSKNGIIIEEKAEIILLESVEIDLSLINFEKNEKFTPVSSGNVFRIISNREIILPNPILGFPKSQNLNLVFSLYKRLYDFKDRFVQISFTYKDESALSQECNDLLNTAEYLGLINIVEDYQYKNNPSVFISEKNITLQELYLNFLSLIGSFRTINEALSIQINMDGLFDNISRGILYNAFKEDSSVVEEGLSYKEINTLINNMRQWYLAIRQTLSLY